MFGDPVKYRAQRFHLGQASLGNAPTRPIHVLHALHGSKIPPFKIESPGRMQRSGAPGSVEKSGKHPEGDARTHLLSSPSPSPTSPALRLGNPAPAQAKSRQQRQNLVQHRFAPAISHRCNARTEAMQSNIDVIICRRAARSNPRHGFASARRSRRGQELQKPGRGEYRTRFAESPMHQAFHRKENRKSQPGTSEAGAYPREVPSKYDPDRCQGR